MGMSAGGHAGSGENEPQEGGVPVSAKTIAPKRRVIATIFPVFAPRRCIGGKARL